MIPEDFHDFFLGVTGAAGALVGLLFVAISVAPERVVGTDVPIVHQIRTSSALSALLNPLVISLIALIPGDNIGYAATSVGSVGVLYVAATMRGLVEARRTEVLPHGAFGMLTGLLVIMVIDVVHGIRLIAHPHQVSGVSWIAGALVGSLIIGVDRAWEVVGARPRGMWTSLRLILGIKRRTD